MCSLLWRRFLSGVCAALFVSQSYAQQPLALQEAIERSLANNPELKSFGYELAMQEARIEQARARAPMELGVEVEDAAGSGRYERIDNTETTLTVGWVWERGVREHRVRTARAGLDALASEAQLRRLDTATETARRFLAVLTHQEELQELQRALTLAQETHAAVLVRVTAAKAPEAEAARAYAQLSRARLELEHEEHELLTASVRLGAMWGQRATDTERAAVVARSNLLALPTLPDFSVLTGRLNRNPNLSVLLTTERLRDAELALASSQRPAWQFRAGVRRFESSDDAALVFGMTVPLADRRQHQSAVTAARAQAEQVRVQSESLGVQINAELFAMYQEMKHAITEATALREEVLPRMATALDQARYAYERGRYSYMEWLATQREVTDLRRALIEAAANAHRYRIEIERLTGASVYE